MMKIIKTIFLLIVSINFYNTHAEIKNNVQLKFILYDGLTSMNTTSIQKKLNDNADRIMSDLQVENIDTFRVHIWGKNESYLAAQEQNIGRSFPGSAGYVISPNDLAILNVGNIAEIAEHEFVHAITLHVNSVLPRRWLWEAVAAYESNEFFNPKSINYLASENYPTIAELDLDYNTGAIKIYQVGYLIIEFIINKWKKEKIVELIKNGGDIQNALNLSESEFEKQWKSFVNEKYLA